MSDKGYHILAGTFENSPHSLLEMVKKYQTVFSKECDADDFECNLVSETMTTAIIKNPINGIKASLAIMLHTGIPDLIDACLPVLHKITNLEPLLLKEVVACYLGYSLSMDQLDEISQGDTVRIKACSKILARLKAPQIEKEIAAAVDYFCQLYTTRDRDLAHISTLLPFTSIGALIAQEAMKAARKELTAAARAERNPGKTPGQQSKPTKRQPS